MSNNSNLIPQLAAMVGNCYEFKNREIQIFAWEFTETGEVKFATTAGFVTVKKHELNQFQAVNKETKAEVIQTKSVEVVKTQESIQRVEEKTESIEATVVIHSPELIQELNSFSIQLLKDIKNRKVLPETAKILNDSMKNAINLAKVNVDFAVKSKSGK